MDGIKVLNTAELNDKIKQIFNDEKEMLIIISPFFIKMDNILIDILKKSSANIYFFYQKSEYYNVTEISNLIKDLSNIKFIGIDYLHAKAYISKKHTIITSLNLNSTNYRNNFEIGIFFENELFKEQYNELLNQIRIILKENDLSFLIEAIFKKDDEKFWDKYNRNRPESRRVLNMKYLYRGIMEKNGKDWTKDDENDKIYSEICEHLISKYKDWFDGLYENPYYKYDKNILNRQAWINDEIYEYSINYFKL